MLSFRVPCPCGCPVRFTSLSIGSLRVKFYYGYLYVALGNRYLRLSSAGFTCGRS